MANGRAIAAHGLAAVEAGVNVVGSLFNGTRGQSTCSIFRLDPLGNVPLEPLADIVPGYTPLRVTLDMIDGESKTCEYDATEHAIQDTMASDIISHVRKRLKSITISGTLNAMPPMLPAPVPNPPAAFARFDLLRMRNLEAIADTRQLVMVTTPRVSLARAFIVSLAQSWSPSDGESLNVSITFREARVVSALLASAVSPDFPSQVPGNNAASSGGQSVASPVSNVTVTPSATPGVAPKIGAAA